MVYLKSSFSKELASAKFEMIVFDPINPLANETVNFSTAKQEEIVAWFDENAKPLLQIGDEEELTNVITVEQLQEFLALKKFHRRSFNYPSYGNIMKIVDSLGMQETRTLTKDQFIYILNKFVILPELNHELKLAFKVFDTEKRGYLELDDVTAIVTGLGNVFQPQELRELLRDMNIKGDGNVFYEEFVDTMFRIAPELNKLKAEFLYEDPDEDPSVPPLPPEPEPPPPPPPKQPEAEAPPPPAPPADKKKKDKKKANKNKKK